VVFVGYSVWLTWYFSSASSAWSLADSISAVFITRASATPTAALSNGVFLLGDDLPLGDGFSLLDDKLQDPGAVEGDFVPIDEEQPRVLERHDGCRGHGLRGGVGCGQTGPVRQRRARAPPGLRSVSTRL
jgi:hypothetical protein